MRTPLTRLAALLVLSQGVTAWSQDPKFREPEPARAPATTNAPAADDSNAAASRMNSMEQLDNTTPLRIGDRVSLRIVEDRDKTLSLQIQESGDIQAPHLGLVKAAGQTCKNVAFAMKRELEHSYLQHATVIVALESRIKGPTTAYMEYFTVFGQVQRQGKYEMTQDEELTVSQALLRAGGPTPFAKMSKVKVIRKVPGKGNVPIIIDCDKIMKKGRLELDIPIRPNDVIIVDEKIFNF